MCKTKTLIYTFTNKAALDECLEDISRTHADKGITFVEIHILSENIPNRDYLSFDELSLYIYTNDEFDNRPKDIFTNNVSIKEIQELVKDPQDLFGEIEVEL